MLAEAYRTLTSPARRERVGGLLVDHVLRSLRHARQTAQQRHARDPAQILLLHANGLVAAKWPELIAALRAEGARNHSRCDSLLLGDECGAHTFPYLEVKNATATVEHEATTSKIGEDQLFYCRQRGLSEEDAVSMIVNGFCKEVLRELPMEFAVEAQNLLGLSLEGAVG